jgi:hypothetical protein
MLKTRARVRFDSRLRRVFLTSGGFSIGDGASKRVRLKLTSGKLGLVESMSAARHGLVFVRVGDAAGNTALIRQDLGLVAPR